MGKEILTFDDKKKKKKIPLQKSYFLKDVDIEKVLVSNKISSGEKNYKYFIGYLYNDLEAKLLHIMLPKTSAYVKRYDGQTKQMYFLNKDDDFLEKYNTICGKVSGDIKKEFDRKSVCNKELLKTIIKSHGDKVTYLSSSNGF